MQFRGSGGREVGGEQWVRLTPAGISSGRAFDIKLTLTWRRLRISLEPHRFAAVLISAMGEVGDVRRIVYRSVLKRSVELGARVRFAVNGRVVDIDNENVWKEPWRRLELEMSRGISVLDRFTSKEEVDHVRSWSRRFAAAVLAIAPLEERDDAAAEGVEGVEGTKTAVRGVRYERDRRNRAAAIAIHGLACLACGLTFGERYGAVAEGFIEIHHVVPLGILKGPRVVDPATDLVPLCSNCHSVAHRRNPPFSVEEIRALLQ